MESSNHPSSNRPKPLIPSPASTSKNKNKMEEEPPSSAAADPAAEEAMCAICLSDVGQSMRGRIDSCDHFFCFDCIMEWAKVETRCPMCKQRFRSVRRPADHGTCRCDRILDVPLRDQAYYPVGDRSITAYISASMASSITDPEPYADICDICGGTSRNEELLLLCDLCDKACHTYCVGLGFAVPEGDWYCPDCIESGRITLELARTLTMRPTS